MTKIELKRIAQEALEKEYGFTPALNKIVLMECTRDGEYIMFSVSDKEYQYNAPRVDRFGRYVAASLARHEF